MASEFKLVRSKVKPKPLEVNIDTVYVRTQFRKLEGLDVWKYKEKYMDKDEYFESLVTRTEHEGITDSLQMLLSQVTELQFKVDDLQKKVDTLLLPKEPEPTEPVTPTPVQLNQVTEVK